MVHIPTLTLIEFSYGITPLPLQTRQRDSGGDFAVVAGGGGVSDGYGVISTLLVVLSSTQLPSISFLLLL